jgi:hypothetical protein
MKNGATIGMSCDHDPGHLVMSQSNKLFYSPNRHFDKFASLGPKTPTLLLIEVKTISNLGVKPGRPHVLISLTLCIK